MYKVISYLGSKQKLLPFLSEIFFENHNKEDKFNFYDCFSGTTSVLNFISRETKWGLNGSDISLYSYILSSLISFKQEERHIKLLKELDTKKEEGIFFNEFGMGGVPGSITNYEIFKDQLFCSRMFFKADVARKIDGIRNTLKEWYRIEYINKEELNYFLLFLLHYIDNYANTTSVFGAYLKYNKHEFKKVSFVSEKLINSFKINKPLSFFIGDIFSSLSNIEYKKENIIYLDPPYNTRRYESNYHILNYLVDLNFSSEYIKDNSKSAMPKDNFKNLFGSKNTFKKAFKDMLEISLEKSDHVYISLNSEGCFSQEDIEEFAVNNKVNLKTYRKDYKRFTSGEANGINNGEKNEIEELVWYLFK